MFIRRDEDERDKHNEESSEDIVSLSSHHIAEQTECLLDFGRLEELRHGHKVRYMIERERVQRLASLLDREIPRTFARV